MARKGNAGTQPPANPNRQVHIPADIRALREAGNEIAGRIVRYIRSIHSRRQHETQ